MTLTGCGGTSCFPSCCRVYHSKIRLNSLLMMCSPDLLEWDVRVRPWWFLGSTCHVFVRYRHGSEEKGHLNNSIKENRTTCVNFSINCFWKKCLFFSLYHLSLLPPSLLSVESNILIEVALMLIKTCIFSTLITLCGSTSFCLSPPLTLSVTKQWQLFSQC